MCEYCNKNEKLYYENRYGDLYINTFGNARTLEVKLKGCPPYAKCCLKDVPISIVYPIKYCPECGRKLCEESNG